MWLNSNRMPMIIDQNVVIQCNIPFPLEKIFGRVLIEEVAIDFVTIF